MVAVLLRKPIVWVLAVVLAGGAAFGLYWFQPWRLFTDTEVHETVPVLADTPTSLPGTPAATGAPATPSAPAGNRLLASGSFITHEHETSGRVQLVQLADGRRQLVLLDLRTSDGPDLRVWLSDQAVRSGTGGWRVFDDGRWLELGRLKGNRGDQIYEIPATANLDGLDSVSIWCRRFAVSFGAAALTPA